MHKPDGPRDAFERKFEDKDRYPACPKPGHQGDGFKIEAYGFARRGPGGERKVEKFRCTSKVTTGTKTTKTTHFFTRDTQKVPAPEFARLVCPEHPEARVIRHGVHSRLGVARQEYKCYGPPVHRFSTVLPRARVPLDGDWQAADAVVNPHRGDLASARGHTSSAVLVAEGLQMLANGRSYAEVGEWAAQNRPRRIPKDERDALRVWEREAKRAENLGLPAPSRPEPTEKDPPKNPRANAWQSGADWCEVFSPLLFDTWVAEINEVPMLPGYRIVVLDDAPFYGGPKRVNGKGENQKQLFSVLVLTEYFRTSEASQRYQRRTRLIRAFPSHTAGAYKLMFDEIGYIPDVIIADGSKPLKSLLDGLHATPEGANVIWGPSPFHVVKQMRPVLKKMTDRGFVPGDLTYRMENWTFLNSPQEWERWWHDLDNRMDTQSVAVGVRPNTWRKTHYERVLKGLQWRAENPSSPGGTSGVESIITQQVKPFLGRRYKTFTNIERTNRLLDLLTLRMNGKMGDRAAITALLVADAEAEKGYAPRPRTITDPRGAKSLMDKSLVPEPFNIKAQKHAAARPYKKRARVKKTAPAKRSAPRPASKPKGASS